MFNKGWKARESGLPIVANDVFCSKIQVDDSGSQWMIVFAIDYGCQEGERLVEAGFPGDRLSKCTECPEGVRCSGRQDPGNRTEFSRLIRI